MRKFSVRNSEFTKVRSVKKRIRERNDKIRFPTVENFTTKMILHNTKKLPTTVVHQCYNLGPADSLSRGPTIFWNPNTPQSKITSNMTESIVQ